MNRPLNRRRFLQKTALSSAGLLILGDRRSAFTYQAQEKVNVALVGVAGRGGWFVNTMPDLANVVAMCDVNERKAAGAFDKLAPAKVYHDFRKMLDEMDRQIDAVVVATPDNTHAVITAAAIKRGKHVLTEKPLTHDVLEARRLRELAIKHRLVTQMGNQGTASRAFREAVDIIQAGHLGNIQQVHAWNTGGGAGPRELPAGKHPVPDYIHWDLWLGPAQWRDYHSSWMRWHTWRDFATGALGNWACHTMNVIFKALKLDTLWRASATSDPKERVIGIDPEIPHVCQHTFPRNEIIRFQFPARGDLPPVQVNWYNGPGQAPGPRAEIEELMGRHLDWGDAGEKRWQDHAGCLLLGTEGMLHANGHNTEYTLFPTDKFRNFKLTEKKLPQSRGHEREWLDACNGGPRPLSNFDYAGPLAEFVLLGNIATLVGQKIEYDPVSMKVLNHEGANQALRRQYREGWSL